MGPLLVLDTGDVSAALKRFAGIELGGQKAKGVADFLSGIAAGRFRSEIDRVLEQRDLAFAELRATKGDCDTYRPPLVEIDDELAQNRAIPIEWLDIYATCKKDAPKDDCLEQCSTEWRDYRPADCSS